ncbi:MAG TPA: hypothetical protein VF598_14060 [Hymenobacter sp.]|jgi:hypothetical protein
MDAPKFYNGQAVVCILRADEWRGSDLPPAPPKGKVLHVLFTARDYHHDCWLIALMEYGIHDGYDQDAFVPAEELPDEAIAELVENSIAELV